MHKEMDGLLQSRILREYIGKSKTQEEKQTIKQQTSTQKEKKFNYKQ